ncbi:GNAT family N-acetyltransferase [Pseudogracilibacillus sp. ICA-222130]|uniref:GNAT family N-acetyltransferase n=1 Tax=Pseudogracilibacillus sp. ICA-222130 TaxID=3134655 RepID=UPI0030C34324
MEETFKLRPVEQEDSHFLHRLFNDQEVVKFWFVEPFYSVQKIKNIVEESLKDRENRRFIFQNDKEKLGYITLYNIEEVHGKAEFAIMIDPIQQGKGYAKIATKLAIDYAFRVLNLRKLYLIVDATNIIARKVYEKMGFVEEAVLKEEYFVDGEYHDAIHMSIFQRDYFKK